MSVRIPISLNVCHALNVMRRYARTDRFVERSNVDPLGEINSGTSQPGQICTSHIERSNLTVRMQNRRWTRLTNAFGKKWENHELMFALFVAWYNFCRVHMTLKTTPAVAAGMTAETWTVGRLLRESAQSARTC